MKALLPEEQLVRQEKYKPVKLCIKASKKRKQENVYLLHYDTTDTREDQMYLLKYSKLFFMKSFNSQSMQRSYDPPASSDSSLNSLMLESEPLINSISY